MNVQSYCKRVPQNEGNQVVPLDSAECKAVDTVQACGWCASSGSQPQEGSRLP